MCGRFTLKSPPKSVADLFTTLQKTLAFDAPESIATSYNVAPTQNVLTARQRKPGELEFAELRWGLVPFWAKDLKIGSRMLNARGETVATKPSFRSAFKKKRCLVVADGFYEWQKLDDGSKQPFYITMKHGGPFCFAGLWETWGKDEEYTETCTVITTEANEIMQPLHDRMPVILEEEQYEMWLDPEFQDTQALEGQLKQYSSDQMLTTPVSTFVNKVANNTPECIEPVA